MPVDVHAAKSQLSMLLEKAENGEEIIIARNGHPIVKLVPCQLVELRPRSPGGSEGKVVISEDFDDLPQPLKEAFGSETPISLNTPPVSQ